MKRIVQKLLLLSACCLTGLFFAPNQLKANLLQENSDEKTVWMSPEGFLTKDILNTGTPAELVLNVFQISPNNVMPNATTSSMQIADCLVTNTNDSGQGSLREAIHCANGDPNADLIGFDISGSPPYVITLLTVLPALYDEGIIIDGTTQPNYQRGDIQISGASFAEDGFEDGLSIFANNCSIFGLYIKDFPEYGIYSTNVSNLKIGDSFKGNVISGNGYSVNGGGSRGGGLFLQNINTVEIYDNYVGTDETGMIANTNFGYGIHLWTVSYAQIGSSDFTKSNVILGFDFLPSIGVGFSSFFNRIEGNKIGVNANGNAQLGDQDVGISVDSGSVLTWIGGLNSGQGNVISGANNYGVLINGQDTQNTLIQGNFIGTDATGSYAIPNGVGSNFSGNGGIYAEYGDYITIEANVISGNSTGITIPSWQPTNHIHIFNNSIGSDVNRFNPIPNNKGIECRGINTTIESNFIFANGTGINLCGSQNRLTKNSFSCNNSNSFCYYEERPNAPFITNMSTDIIQGVGSPSQIVEVFLFSDDGCQGGVCQGTVYEGTAFTDEDGNWSLYGNFTLGSNYTATTTDLNNNTSYFAPCYNFNFDNPCNTVNGTTVTVINKNDDGYGSLRRAIECANNDPNIDFIHFDIPGSGIHEIELYSALPSLIDDGIVIDATTQSNWTRGTIRLNGANLPQNNFVTGVGINITGSDCAVYGLHLQRFAYGVRVEGLNTIVGDDARGNVIDYQGSTGIGIGFNSQNTTIRGNYIGTDVTGTIVHNSNSSFNSGISSNGNGVSIINNVVSGHKNNGISIGGSGNALVQGNLIGTDVTGTYKLGNRYTGLALDSEGGTVEVLDNIIVNNGLDGITDFPYHTSVTIKGNYIGTNPAGANLGNGRKGIWRYDFNSDFVSQATIGGAGADANVIAFNEVGIELNGSKMKNTHITQNSIYCNKEGGIFLNMDENERKATPRISMVTASTISGVAEANDVIEVFASDDSECMGQPCQGKIYIGTTITNNLGQWTLNGSFDAQTFFSATATDVNNITSQFSACVSSQGPLCTLASDSLELVNLYNATNGANWFNSWDLNTPVETWYGVVLTLDKCRVKELNLYQNGLNGTLVDLNLPALTMLYVSNNFLSGTFPSLANCPNIKFLAGSNNQFSGVLPDFSHMTDLRQFWFDFNQLEGNVPDLSNSPNLFDIILRNNNFTGSVPAGLASLSNLGTLMLQNNNLSGTLPDFSALENIYTFRVDYNDFDFSDLETNIVANQTIDDFRYSPQNPIPIYEQDYKLVVEAGGNVWDNYYEWYKDGNFVHSVNGDNTYAPTEIGNYYCRVYNNLVSNASNPNQYLRLVTELIYFEPPANIVTFTIEEACGSQNSVLSIPVSVKNFTNISGFQYSIHIPPHLGYLADPPVSGMNLNNLSTGDFTRVDDYTLTVAWESNNIPNGETLVDETAIFNIDVQMAGGPNSAGTVYFNGYPTPVEVVQGFNVVGARLIDGVTCVLGTFTIEGQIFTHYNAAVNNVSLEAVNYTNQYAYTDNTGYYRFPAVDANSDVTLFPYKNYDAKNGVTIADVVQIKGHILNIMSAKFDNPYQYIAADVNGSGSVTIADVLFIKQVIREEVSSFPINQSWRFVPADYVFPDPENPYAFPEEYNYMPMDENQIGQNFIGIKLGDVNESVNPNQLTGEESDEE